MNEHNDVYYTLAAPAEGRFSEQRSRFLSFAFPVFDEKEAASRVNELRHRFCDARHVCWAYRLGNRGERFRVNDDGEPSGTAGKPILGRLLAEDLTFTLVIVVRYFGGIKLGTGGLITAYRAAADAVLSIAERKAGVMRTECIIDFDYPLLGEAMRIAKENTAEISAQDFRERCRLHLCVRLSAAPALYARIRSTYGLTLCLPEEERDGM